MKKLKELSSTLSFYHKTLQAGIYLFKVNNRNTRTRCEICSKLTTKIPKRRQWFYQNNMSRVWSLEFRDMRNG